MYGSLQRFQCSPGGFSFFQASSRVIGAPCSIVHLHAAVRPLRSIAISPTVEISSLYLLYKIRRAMAVTIMTLKSSSGTSRPCKWASVRPSPTAQNCDIYINIYSAATSSYSQTCVLHQMCTIMSTFISHYVYFKTNLTI